MTWKRPHKGALPKPPPASSRLDGILPRPTDSRASFRCSASRSSPPTSLSADGVGCGRMGSSPDCEPTGLRARAAPLVDPRPRTAPGWCSMIGVAETGWLLEKVISHIRRFVVMSHDQALAVGLWVLLTWAVEAFDCAPYLDVSSPSRECGKTRLFEALQLLVRRPRKCTGHTEATLFRMIESEHPTLLMDEIDTTFGKDPKLYAGFAASWMKDTAAAVQCPHGRGGEEDADEVLRGVRPEGLRRHRQLSRDIASRSIPIRLERKSRTEKVARFRYGREWAATAEPERRSRSGRATSFRR